MTHASNLCESSSSSTSALIAFVAALALFTLSSALASYQLVDELNRHSNKIMVIFGDKWYRFSCVRFDAENWIDCRRRDETRRGETRLFASRALFYIVWIWFFSFFFRILFFHVQIEPMTLIKCVVSRWHKLPLCLDLNMEISICVCVCIYYTFYTSFIIELLHVLPKIPSRGVFTSL